MPARHTLAAAAVLLLISIVGTELSAQSTGMPTFRAPTRAFPASEIGLTLSRPGGSTTGYEGQLVARLQDSDLALRGGYVDPGGSAEGVWVAGAEVRMPLLRGNRDVPVDWALLFGAGHRFVSGGGDWLFPLGLSVGRRVLLDGSALHLTPYVQPTVLFDDDTRFTLGLGLDLGIRGFPDVRLNGAVGDLDGFSISLFWTG